jgi:hypothetical protein
MATIVGKRQCPNCQQWVSSNSLAWASHRKACTKR